MQRNKQQTFDHVWNTFIVEQQPAGYDTIGGSCVYRNDDGLGCAIGACLPAGTAVDSFCGPVRWLKDNSYGHLSVLEAAFTPDVLADDFLDDMQNAHDESAKELDARATAGLRTSPSDIALPSRQP